MLCAIVAAGLTACARPQALHVTDKDRLGSVSRWALWPAGTRPDADVLLTSGAQLVVADNLSAATRQRLSEAGVLVFVPHAAAPLPDHIHGTMLDLGPLAADPTTAANKLQNAAQSQNGALLLVQDGLFLLQSRNPAHRATLLQFADGLILTDLYFSLHSPVAASQRQRLAALAWRAGLPLFGLERIAPERFGEYNTAVARAEFRLVPFGAGTDPNGPPPPQPDWYVRPHTYK